MMDLMIHDKKSSNHVISEAPKTPMDRENRGRRHEEIDWLLNY